MTLDRRTTRFGPLQRRLLALLALGPTDTLEAAARLAEPLHRIRASLTALRHRRVVERGASPSLGWRRGRLPATWRLATGAPRPFPRRPEGIARDEDVLEGLGDLGTASVPELVEHLGRPRANVIRALRSLVARELVERVAPHRWAVLTRPATWPEVDPWM